LEGSGHPDGFGPFEGRYDGRWFHGSPGDHVFRVVRRPFGDATNPGNKMIIRNWNPVEDTAMPAERFCGNCRHKEYHDGADHYVCLGHDLVSDREALDADDQPAGRDEHAADQEVPGLPGHDRVVGVPADMAEVMRGIDPA